MSNGDLDISRIAKSAEKALAVINVGGQLMAGLIGLLQRRNARTVIELDEIDDGLDRALAEGEALQAKLFGQDSNGDTPPATEGG